MDKVIKKGNIKDLKNDYKYWISRPYIERLKAIEEIRKEYNLWKYGPEQGFQRVFKVINKDKSSS